MWHMIFGAKYVLFQYSFVILEHFQVKFKFAAIFGASFKFPALFLLQLTIRVSDVNDNAPKFELPGKLTRFEAENDI